MTKFSIPDIGQTCSVCKRVVEPREYGEPGERWCSEYCEMTTDEEKAFYLEAQPGDFCTWPCPICGCAVEDDMMTNSCCAGCVPEKKIRELRAALREACEIATYLNSYVPKFPAEGGPTQTERRLAELLQLANKD